MSREQMMSLFLQLDDTDVKNKLAEDNAALDDFTRRHRQAQSEMRMFVRQSLQMFNQTYALFSTFIELSGQSIDALFASYISVIQGAISVATTTLLLAQAQTFLGNALAGISIFLASVSLGKSIRTMEELMKDRNTSDRTINRMKRAVTRIGQQGLNITGFGGI